ncbi:hypothetical protein GQ55_5G485100 [Panicum hallii var. hallii]|uniref:Uncharacterized protein n=1 Tax=Panicum hallii var. hallii TaxID=1504633 RepID=A0A2T7DRD8_9POAL|nr:hypothetical protein GQ55_5G485100 [Panicum hallii var. hallii]
MARALHVVAWCALERLEKAAGLATRVHVRFHQRRQVRSPAHRIRRIQSFDSSCRRLLAFVLLSRVAEKSTVIDLF